MGMVHSVGSPDELEQFGLLTPHGDGSRDFYASMGIGVTAPNPSWGWFTPSA